MWNVSAGKVFLHRGYKIVLLAKMTACDQVVQSTGDINKPVHDSLAVASAISSIETVPAVQLAERLKGRILVVEELNKNKFKLA